MDGVFVNRHGPKHPARVLDLDTGAVMEFGVDFDSLPWLMELRPFRNRGFSRIYSLSVEPVDDGGDGVDGVIMSASPLGFVQNAALLESFREALSFTDSEGSDVASASAASESEDSALAHSTSELDGTGNEQKCLF